MRKLQVMESRVLYSLDDTKKLAMEIVQKIGSRQVIGLQGEMGSGKTHFVKALAEALGLNGQSTSSPTFAIHHQYQNELITLHHLDLFRLESAEEIESSGFGIFFMKIMLF